MTTKSSREIIDQISKIREAANLLIEHQLSLRGIEGVVPAHGIIFANLFKQNGPVPIMFLVHKSGRAKSTVTGIIKTLERHGYIYRQASTDDGRSFVIGLTEKGWSIKSDFEEISDLLIQKIYGNMPGKDRASLVKLLAQIEKNMG